MTSEQMVNWADRVVHRLIHRAAKRAPGALSERLEEEWLADLADRRGSLSRLRFAVGCCWATSVIAHDRELGLLPAAEGPVATGGSGFGSGSSLPPAWRRTAAFIVVAGLHITVFYAFVMGLDVKFHPSHVGPMAIVRVPVVPKNVVPPPPPPTGFSPPKIDYLPPDFLPFAERNDQITVDPPVAKNTGQDLFDPPVTPNPPVVRHVMGGPGNGFPIPDDFYPSAAIHMGETGAATVKVCVNSKGRLTSVPSIEESTGSIRLDGGAINLAKAGSGHYRPSTDDGRPVDSCYAFRVRFNLKN